jgi:hypothetical protein
MISWRELFNAVATERYIAAVYALEDNEKKALRQCTAKVALVDVRTGVVKISYTDTPLSSFVRISRENLDRLQGDISRDDCSAMIDTIIKQLADRPFTNTYFAPLHKFLPEIREQSEHILDGWQRGSFEATELKASGVCEPYLDAEPDTGTGICFTFPCTLDVPTTTAKIQKFLEPFFWHYTQQREQALALPKEELRRATDYQILYLLEKEFEDKALPGATRITFSSDLAAVLHSRIVDDGFMRQARARFQGILGDLIYKMLEDMLPQARESAQNRQHWIRLLGANRVI